MNMQKLAVKKFMEAAAELAVEIASKGPDKSTKNEAEFVISFTMVHLMKMMDLTEDLSKESEEK